ncbi:replication initiation and membrane attachment protein [Paenibacillus sp. J31TS4]|uniref:helicase DnaB n=1 Tax=Paenibacillus sp. J31TS4 TaxID=2807195 RepID=UPI001AFE7197|nr:helicase DnaB [Paenibacillus sp. J31TS4]GIP40716.1 replication initiation and membrane attachment protein [Paenibacillus sp. J31TS4]
MKVSNLLHFTENHRFCVSREFALGPLEYRLLYALYQPMIGAAAVSVYQTLYQQLPVDKVGCSGLEQQRKLFLSLGIDPGERGRKQVQDLTSLLEAVGLLQTFRRLLVAEEEYIYEYQLAKPLAPAEFFRNQHLTLLLRDKVGKYTVLALKDELTAEEPEELAESQPENLSVPFYDLFQLNTRVIDYELEQALYQAAPAKAASGQPDVVTKGFDYADIIQRFPRGSVNRPHVEAFKYRPDQLAVLNLTAKKYRLSLQETCRLLDEDDLFDEEGRLREEVLKAKANELYRQMRSREEQVVRQLARKAAAEGEEATPAEEKPVEMAYYLEVPTIFQGQCNIHQYNMILRNEPYTLVLERFFPQGSVPDGVLNIFEKIDLNYRLNEEVINVLIHFLHTDRRSWAKSSIEAVASDMLGKQVLTYEQAVDYIREKARYKEQAAKGGYARGGGSRSTARTAKPKPKLPVVTEAAAARKLSEEELERIRRKALKLDGKL